MVSGSIAAAPRPATRTDRESWLHYRRLARAAIASHRRAEGFDLLRAAAIFLVRSAKGAE